MPPKGAEGGVGFCDCARRGARATLADRRPETYKHQLVNTLLTVVLGLVGNCTADILAGQNWQQNGTNSHAACLVWLMHLFYYVLNKLD